MHEGETMQLTQSTTGQGSSRSSRRGDLALLSLLNIAPPRPSMLKGTRDPRTASVSCAHHFASPAGTCGQQLLALLLLQKPQLISSRAASGPKGTSQLCLCMFMNYYSLHNRDSTLSGSGVYTAWHNSMQNQSICTDNLKVRDMKMFFWRYPKCH